jgi:hypothetical protein
LSSYQGRKEVSSLPVDKGRRAIFLKDGVEVSVTCSKGE